jgi:hypothetical protein
MRVHTDGVSVWRHKDELDGREPGDAVLPGGRRDVLSGGRFAA